MQKLTFCRNSIYLKFLKIILITILFALISREASNYIFQSNKESRVYNTGFYFLSQKPLSAEYNFDSLFTPYHIYLIGYRPSPENFVRYFDTVRVLTYAVLFFYFYWFENFFIASLVGTISVISPMTLIGKTWISFPDTYTFFFSCLFFLLIYSKDKIENKKIYYFLFSIISIFGLLNHFYQFILISLQILLVNFYFSRDSKLFYKSILSFILLVFLVRASTQILFYLNHLEMNDYRVAVVKSLTISEIIKFNFTNFWMGAYGFLFGLWIVFTHDTMIKKNYILPVILVISFVITCFTFDTTRVFSLLFFPPFLFAYSKNLSRYTLKDKKNTVFLLFLSVLVYFIQPLFYKWGERIIYLK